MSPPDIWKWKWSNGVGKSEMSIIWCISITNNMKSNKKFNETAQTTNFTDFPLILCGNGPKGTKTMQTQTFYSQIGKRYSGDAIGKLTSMAFGKCGCLGGGQPDCKIPVFFYFFTPSLITVFIPIIVPKSLKRNWRKFTFWNVVIWASPLQSSFFFPPERVFEHLKNGTNQKNDDWSVLKPPLPQQKQQQQQIAKAEIIKREAPMTIKSTKSFTWASIVKYDE